MEGIKTPGPLKTPGREFLTEERKDKEELRATNETREERVTNREPRVAVSFAFQRFGNFYGGQERLSAHNKTKYASKIARVCVVAKQR